MVAVGHIGGERAAAFQRRVAGLDPDRVLLVGVDVAKPTWFGPGCTLTGEIVLEERQLAGFVGPHSRPRIRPTTPPADPDLPSTARVRGHCRPDPTVPRWSRPKRCACW
jgi:hypothetical protein